MDLKSFLFSFDGRINRSKYWFALVIYAAAGLVFIMILFIALGMLDPSDRTSLLGLLPILVLAAPMVVASIWSWAATTIKRLHDRDKSGWWMIPFFVLPSILQKAADWIGGTYGAIAVGLVVVAIGIWSFVETYCLKGTSGSNRFGPDPLIRVKSQAIAA